MAFYKQGTCNAHQISKTFICLHNPIPFIGDKIKIHGSMLDTLLYISVIVVNKYLTFHSITTCTLNLYQSRIHKFIGAASISIFSLVSPTSHYICSIRCKCPLHLNNALRNMNQE